MGEWMVGWSLAGLVCWFLSCLTCSVVTALTSHLCGSCLIPNIGKRAGLWLPGQIAGFSFGVPVSPHRQQKHVNQCQLDGDP